MANETENEEFNPDIYTLIDEEGVEQTFELLDVMELDDERYFALVPYYEEPTEILDDDGDLIILKSKIDENDEELMVSIDDEEEYQRVGEIFLQKLSEIFEEEILEDGKTIN
ncbi:MAG: DUF1292 domain-containing protein [Oscillospiraceae bacterium]